MTRVKTFIGTAGWSYSYWRKVFYTENIVPKQYLAFYAKAFNAAEINSSFYGLPRLTTVENWMSQVPEDFKFCVKISRHLTHFKKLDEPEDALKRFFKAISPMKKMLGPILVQLPASLQFDYETAEYLFRLLKKNYSDYDFALEVRHATWTGKESFDLMTKYNIGFVIAESGDRFPYVEMATAKNIYLRFHGGEKLYASSYSDEVLKEYAQKILEWEKDGHVVWVFFNNTMYEHGLKNALKLKELLGAEVLIGKRLSKSS